MAGARFPGNAGPPDSGITAAANGRAAQYYATSAQSLYSDLWQDMRTYINAYCSVTRTQQHPAVASPRTPSSSLTDFSSPSSNHSSLSYQQPFSYPRDLEGSVNFGSLQSQAAAAAAGGGNAHSHSHNHSHTHTHTHPHAIPLSLDTGNDPHTVAAPTIQFDLGSNLLGSNHLQQQQGNLNNFSSPYSYSTEAPMDASVDANQSCFSTDSSLTSTLWNLGNNFACPPAGQTDLSSPTLANGPTVDFTARWDMRNGLNSSSPVQQSSVSSNGGRTQPFVGRLRPYVREPSVAVLRRIDSALEQRLYVIDRKVVGDPQDPTACDFQVLGATGNVYTVRLSTVPSCTCADTIHPCKHILFIMLRVLKLSQEDYRIWQEALFASEVNELIRKPIIDSDALSSQKVRLRFQDISNHQGSQGLGEKNLQREVSGDCPVCFEEMGHADGMPKEDVSFCKVCGNNVHKDCFQRWSLSKQESGERVTCVFCRSMWFDDSLQLKKRKAASEVPADSGYVNISDYSTDHQVEDMSLEGLYPTMRPKFVPEWRGC